MNYQNDLENQMAVTAKDVARLAEVSPSTVSRVINNDSRISLETTKRVKKIIDELDYKVNNIARSLKTRQTYTVGFIAPEIAEEFFMRVAKGAEKILQQAGYSLIICNADENLENETDRVKLLEQKQVDGVIIIPSTSDGSSYEILRKQGIPVVLADRNVENFEADIVMVDNTNGTYWAIEHLINEGARRIGFIGGRRSLSNAKERYEGYLRAMADYNIPVLKELVKFGDFHIDSGYELTKELLELDTPPEHLFISNGYMHLGALKYLLEQEGRGPRPVSIAGFDDMPLSTLLGHASVTISQPVIEIGEKAAQVLLDRIRTKNVTDDFQTYRLKPKMLLP